jgi:hypothetical protein
MPSHWPSPEMILTENVSPPVVRLSFCVSLACVFGCRQGYISTRQGRVVRLSFCVSLVVCLEADKQREGSNTGSKIRLCLAM